MLRVETVETQALGDRSYLVHDGSTAVVIDAQRDLDRMQEALAAAGVELAAVAETHIHNDYVTGGLALAESHHVDYLVAAADDVAFDRRPVADGDELQYDGLRVRVIATPGHTYHHLTYAISTDSGDSTGHNNGDVAVFTGGSLLYGSVGRTDLVGADSTDELTRAQYRSARKLADMLPDHAAVYPTHGFGSFCSAGAVTGSDASTIGTEKTVNDALTEPDEDTFVERLVANFTAYPAYYAHMSARNLAGPAAADLSEPEPVDAAELHRRLEAGEWVVDLRNRRAYSAGHVHRTIGVELGTPFATHLGWILPWGTPLTLLGETPEQVADAQRQLVRIGIDRPDGAAVGDVAAFADAQQLRTYPVADFAELRHRLREVAEGGDSAGDGRHEMVVLDVRRDDEHAESAVRGSFHLPLHDLLTHLDAVPAGTLWVHCASGYRASIASSLLSRAGRDVVLIDDEYTTAQELGLTD